MTNGPRQPAKREPIVPNAVLGVIIFMLTEIMLFSGFVSAHTIAKTNVPAWPPLDQPRLPIEATAGNSVVLLLSGVALWWAGRQFAKDPARARTPFTISMALGALFVAIQGYEWFNLVSEGLTLSSSTYGAFFYLIVGAHAIHAVGGLGAMLRLYVLSLRGQLEADGFWAGRIYWYFVVGLWPFLYYQVYL